MGIVLFVSGVTLMGNWGFPSEPWRFEEEAWESLIVNGCLVLMPNLLTATAEDERDKGRRKRAFLLSDIGIAVTSGSFNGYIPVLGSASGALAVIFSSGKLVVPTKSLPDSLSRSITEKPREYLVSCFWT